MCSHRRSALCMYVWELRVHPPRARGRRKIRPAPPPLRARPGRGRGCPSRLEGEGTPPARAPGPGPAPCLPEHVTPDRIRPASVQVSRGDATALLPGSGQVGLAALHVMGAYVRSISLGSGGRPGRRALRYVKQASGPRRYDGGGAAQHSLTRFPLPDRGSHRPDLTLPAAPSTTVPDPSRTVELLPASGRPRPPVPDRGVAGVGRCRDTATGVSGCRGYICPTPLPTPRRGPDRGARATPLALA